MDPAAVVFGVSVDGIGNEDCRGGGGYPTRVENGNLSLRGFSDSSELIRRILSCAAKREGSRGGPGEVASRRRHGACAVGALTVSFLGLNA